MGGGEREMFSALASGGGLLTLLKACVGPLCSFRLMNALANHSPGSWAPAVASNEWGGGNRYNSAALADYGDDNYPGDPATKAAWRPGKHEWKTMAAFHSTATSRSADV